MSRRAVRAGVGLAVLYVVVALATERVASRPVLPLFDGFAPPTPYSWVNPPPARAGDNVVPKPVERTFPLGPDGSPASNASTDDGQAIVGLDKGSVPAQPPDTGVTVRIVPTDPATLGPLPPGMRAVSNAYQVMVSYLPSQVPVTRLAVKGTIALTAAEVGNRMLYSADGWTWEQRDFRPYGTDQGVFTELDAVGWFLVATSSAPRSPATTDGLKVFLLVVGGLAPVIGAVLVLTLPSPVTVAAPTRPGPRSRPAPKKKGRRRR